MEKAWLCLSLLCLGVTSDAVNVRLQFLENVLKAPSCRDSVKRFTLSSGMEIVDVKPSGAVVTNQQSYLSR